MLVAQVDRIGEPRDWSPRYNDLDAIVMHALNWERRLIGRRSSRLTIHPRLTTSSVSPQVSSVAIPAARQMRRRRYGIT